MVSEDLRRLLDYVSKQKILSRGAESEIRVGTLLGRPAVFKLRIRKTYMHPLLDRKLRRQRTLREAKVIARARRAGVPAPGLLLVLPSIYLIVMEYIEGRLLKDELRIRGTKLAREAGRILGLLHKTGIVHGDPTTSNYIVSGNRLVLVDYGLSQFSDSIEDRAVDLHLFRRAVEATHPSLARDAWRDFLEGYSFAMGREAAQVIRRAEEIALRGRWIEERRRTVWDASST